MVTVVDAARFRTEYAKADTLADRNAALGPEDTRTVTDLLIDQVEFADVIILNKMDQVTEAQAGEVEAILHTLNPRAKIQRATMGQVPLETVMDTGLFDYEAAEQSAGWIRELQGEHVPESEEYGISSHVFRAQRPFDAEKLWDYLHNDLHWDGLLRSKGFFWIAADHRVAYEWAQAGGVSTVRPGGMWWAAVPRERWPHPAGARPDQQPNWHPRFGDRCQELVFIGQNLDAERLEAGLNACLMSEKASAQPSRAWQGMNNPFPPLEGAPG
jgi:G3E family GTPase